MRTHGRRRAIARRGIECACIGRRAKRKSVQRLRHLRQRALDRVVLRLGILLGEKPASVHRPSHSSEWRRSRIARPARAVSEALRRPMRQWPSPHGAGDGTTSWAIFRPRGCGWWADDLSAGNHKSRAMLWTPEGANRRLARWSGTGQSLFSAHQTPVTCSPVRVSPPAAAMIAAGKAGSLPVPVRRNPSPCGIGGPSSSM